MSTFGRLLTMNGVSRVQGCSMLSHVKNCRLFSGRKKLTSLDFKSLKNKGKKLTMVTAYDYPTGMHAENAEFDLVLVGDSLGMVILGHETTQTVTMDEMIHHCKATRRGAPNTFIIGDMPFGSYEVNNDDAVRNAFRFLKEAGMDAVKLEGARPETVRRIVDSGIAVMGHIGLTPQGISVLGGFRAQGRTAVKAFEMVQNAVKLEKAGAFALVVECVPSVVARAVQEAVSIPVIGIGAGPHTAGQVLVYHDLLGIMHHPHHEKHVPSFCKRYANFGEAISSSLEQFRDEVRSQAFPSEEFSPYKMSAEEQQKFQDLLLSGSVHSSVAETISSTSSSSGSDSKRIETELVNETIKVY